MARRRHKLALLMLAALSGGVAAAPARRTPVGLTVVNAGSDQALRLGETTLSRPFGAQLVDRLTVVGRHALPGSRTLWLVRGDGGAECPARYVVVGTAPGEAPTVGTPFGT